jgi:hypothetical protein
MKEKCYGIKYVRKKTLVGEKEIWNNRGKYANNKKFGI